MNNLVVRRSKDTAMMWGTVKLSTSVLIPIGMQVKYFTSQM